MFLLCGFCRVAAGPDGNRYPAASKVLGAQSRLWRCTTFLNGGAVHARSWSRGRRDRRIVSQAISGLPYHYIRATVVVAFRFFDLPRPNSSSFRENSHSRRGELSLAHEPSKTPSPHEELARDRTRRRCSGSASSIIAAARRRGLRGAKGRTRGNAAALFAVEHCRRASAVSHSDRRGRPREPFP